MTAVYNENDSTACSVLRELIAPGDVDERVSKRDQVLPVDSASGQEAHGMSGKEPKLSQAIGNSVDVSDHHVVRVRDDERCLRRAVRSRTGTREERSGSLGGSGLSCRPADASILSDFDKSSPCVVFAHGMRESIFGWPRDGKRPSTAICCSARDPLRTKSNMSGRHDHHQQTGDLRAYDALSCIEASNTFSRPTPQEKACRTQCISDRNSLFSCTTYYA